MADEQKTGLLDTQPQAITTDPPISAFVTNLGKYTEGALVGEWLALPTTKEEVQACFARVGLDGIRYEEMFITDYETDVSGLYDKLGEYSGLDELNYLASVLEELDDSEIEKFGAAVEYGEYTGSMKGLINLAQNLDCYDFCAEIEDDEDLGYYWVEDSGVFDTKQMGTLARYIDYERFGRDIRLEEGGCFTKGGYICNNRDRFIEHYDGKEVPEEYRVFAFPNREPRQKRVEREAPEPCR